MRRRSRLGGLSAAVGDVTGALRRRRESREPRVRLYDERGQVRTLDADEPQTADLVDAARAMIAAVTGPPRDGSPQE